VANRDIDRPENSIVRTLTLCGCQIWKKIISNHIHSNSHPQYFEFSRMKYCFLRRSWWFDFWKTSIVRISIFTRTSSETWLYLNQCNIIHKVFFIYSYYPLRWELKRIYSIYHLYFSWTLFKRRKRRVFQRIYYM